MKTQKSIKSYSFYFLMGVILIQGLSGLFGGAALIVDPTGELLNMPVSMLEGSPFDTFLIPGLILFTILGIFPMIVVYGLRNRTIWAWPGAFLVSLALITWISVEILMVGYHAEPPLQLIYGVLGVVLLGLMMQPSVRRALEASKNA